MRGEDGGWGLSSGEGLAQPAFAASPRRTAGRRRRRRPPARADSRFRGGEAQAVLPRGGRGSARRACAPVSAVVRTRPPPAWPARARATASRTLFLR